MNSAWRSRSGADRYAAPVEMRFIDMFMAAVGALIFMSMLFAFLLKYLDRAPPPPPGMPAPEPLDLVTKKLSPARVGEPYEVAFAYRGGAKGIVWEVAAGATELTGGLQFEAKSGILSGTPTQSSTKRFVIRVRDSANATAEHPYELVIDPPRQASRSYDKWLAALLLLAALFFLLRSIIHSYRLKRLIQELQQAADRGEDAVEMKLTNDVRQTINLPGGIATYQEYLRGSQQTSRFSLIIMVVLVAWVIWRFWIA